MARASRVTLRQQRQCPQVRRCLLALGAPPTPQALVQGQLGRAMRTSTLMSMPVSAKPHGDPGTPSPCPTHAETLPPLGCRRAMGSWLQQTVFSTMNWSLVAWLLTGAVAEDSMPAWASCWSWQVAFEIRQPQALALLSGCASSQACCKETCTKWPQPSSSWSSQERLNRRTRGFGSPLLRMDLQTKPAMTPTASVALVVRSCTSTTQTKDRLLADAQHPTYLVGLATQVSTWDEGPPVPGEHPIPAAEWRCTHRAQDGPTTASLPWQSTRWGG